MMHSIIPILFKFIRFSFEEFLLNHTYSDNSIEKHQFSISRPFIWLEINYFQK